VNNIVGDSAVANYLSDNFKKACTPNNADRDLEFKQSYFLNKGNYPEDLDTKFVIDVETVDKAINKISANKAAGHDSLTIEHIKFAHPSLTVILSKLFTIMLYLGVVPDDFGLGITKPIPKFKGNKKSIVADDFRGITVCPIISKIFERCLMDQFCDIGTSDRQFGFKKDSSCQLAINSVKNVVNYFNRRGNTMNIGVIDLKKSI
jgi:hypothetical protein